MTISDGFHQYRCVTFYVDYLLYDTYIGLYISGNIPFFSTAITGNLALTRSCLFYFNCYRLEVVSRHHDPLFQVAEKY